LIFVLFYGVFVRFSTRGVQKHHKNFFGEVQCQKPLAGKIEKKTPFFLSSFPIDFVLSRFWPLAVSLHEEPKNTTEMFSKTRPENLKKSQKK
jgi:hypothetical protein